MDPQHRMVPERHEVTLYDRDDHLVATVADYVADGLRAGEHVLFVATEAHRAALVGLLASRGIDMLRAAAAGAYRGLDAADTLSSFYVGGRLYPELFEANMGTAIDLAAAGDYPVRIYGEMVSLLWDAGNAAGAIELEQLWNDLAETRQFDLLCGYPTKALDAHPELTHINEVFTVHSHVAPPQSYDSLEVPGDGATRVFIGSPAAVPAARRWVKATLSSWGEEQLVPDAALVTSELASNAVNHAATAFRVSLMRSPERVRMEVEDLAPARPQLRLPPEDSTGGRGVLLVALVADNHGHEPTPTGKIVWAEFASSAA